MAGVIVLDVVGLTPGLVSKRCPALQDLARRGVMAPLEAAFPAVTLTAQASLLTGRPPRDHGIVGNGWYWRDLEEPHLWRQPHRLIGCEDFPTRLRRERPGFTVAKLFWWFAQYAPVDWSVTPRPMYPADGRKIPDLHTYPSGLRDELQERHGTFPLFNFWGPLADLQASRWITDAAIDLIAKERPSLSLVYLPHLDYDFQRHGPDDPRSAAALAAVDALVAEFRAASDRLGMDLVVVSEYGITPVDRPVHPNRALRDAGLLATREELGTERLDTGASRAFALADHQVAHVYVRRPEDQALASQVLARLPGVARVLSGSSLAAEGLDHPRSGELLLVAEKNAWFTYYFWNDDARAPDYARTVDIHRKPGYDPAELLLDPALKSPKLRIARRLLARKLGFRNLLDVIGLDAAVVKGSHGLRPSSTADGPVFIASRNPGIAADAVLPIARFPELITRIIDLNASARAQ